jgi:DNA polymerase-1
VIKELEDNMVAVIATLEKSGLDVDLVELESLIAKTEAQKHDIDSALRETLGISGHVNFNSSADVSEILLSHLKVKTQRTKSGRPTTSRFVLKDIHNPITDQIIRFRELEDLLSSLKAIYQATDDVRGQIFCKYVQTCPSGRLYTKDYSLQSIPQVARDVIYSVAGHSFVLVDYNTFELRILSALAKDKYFAGLFAKGVDLHRQVVADMKGIPYESVTDSQRKIGKVLNFSQVYGAQAYGLSRNLNVSTLEAEKLMNAYKKNIPEIEVYKQEQIKKARVTGYSDTFYGRRRFLSDINSPNTANRKQAERRVINHQIQGTAADIVKFAMAKLHQAGFVMNTQLHDAILFTVPDSELEVSKVKIRAIMETEINGLKFPVTVKVGKTWGECYSL